MAEMGDASSSHLKLQPLNYYPAWRYVLIFVVIVLAVIYALPNYFSESPAVQVSAKSGSVMTEAITDQVKTALDSAKLNYNSVSQTQYALSVHFADTQAQMKAQEIILATLGDSYVVALNLEPNTPAWLQALGANPMKYGLDLRGGMYFLLDIDIDSVLKNQLDNMAASFRQDLRENDIRYAGIQVLNNSNPSTVAQNVLKGVLISFRDSAVLKVGQDYLLAHSNSSGSIGSYQVQKYSDQQLLVTMDPQELQQIQETAVQQTIQVMRNRVNGLGVGDATVSQQGKDRIVIELPGLEDAARANQIIGGTATLKVMMVNESADLTSALAGHVPIGSSIYYGSDHLGHQPYVLYNPTILTGKSFVGADLSYDSQTSLPVVDVNLSGPEVSYFSQVTANNVGHLMAIVLVQPKMTVSIQKGVPVTTTTTSSEIISVATVESRLSNNFQIQGIGSARSAQLLAMTIRAGALPAPVQIMEERLIGPTLGAANIHRGAVSVLVALILVMIFMAIYYRAMGFIANTALVLNLILIIAIMSVIPGATLTLPGIAGIVLNLGMAIDSNVLIFERIREEIRGGVGIQPAIDAGYARAFSTIIDANVTTLIVAVILYAVGTGAVKGFAVTLIIGIFCSMFTAILVTRALVNKLWGSSAIKKLSIGI